MEGEPSLKNSTSFAPPTMVAPPISFPSSSLRRLKHGEQTQIRPPALTKFSMSSLRGAKPSSRMSSAYSCWESRTPSVLRKTNVCLSDATAALATTNATVALSGSFFADVRLTQNLPAIILILLSFNPILLMLDVEQRMSRQPTPCRDILRGTGVSGRDPQHLARFHRAQAHPQLQHEIAAGHISGIPGLAFI